MRSEQLQRFYIVVIGVMLLGVGIAAITGRRIDGKIRVEQVVGCDDRREPHSTGLRRRTLSDVRGSSLLQEPQTRGPNSLQFVVKFSLCLLRRQSVEEIC